jgi:hypothetical protein
LIVTPDAVAVLVDADSALRVAAELGKDDELGMLSTQPQDFLERTGWSELVSGTNLMVTDPEGAPLSEIDIATSMERLLGILLQWQDTGVDDWELGIFAAGVAFAAMRTYLPNEHGLFNRLGEDLSERVSPLARLAFTPA